MIGAVTIPSELFALFAGLAGIAFAASLSALGWLILRVAALGESVARIRQRLEDLPCDKCAD